MGKGLFNQKSTQMAFTKFVQIGRVCTLNYGPQEGKTVVILDLVNTNRALIEGTDGEIQRQVIPIRRLSLTKFTLKSVLRGQRSGLLKKKIAKENFQKQWAETPLAKKLASNATKAKLNDFDRFKVMVLKKRVSKSVAHGVKTLRKSNNAKK